jgi:PEGA domain
VRAASAQAGPRAVSPQVARPVYAQRSYAAARPAYEGRAYPGYRTVASPVVVGRAVVRPAYSGGFVGGGRFLPNYGWSGRAVFAEPFFRFRPRFTFGFGLVVGYPVAFPYGYYYSPYDYAYGYPVYGMAEPVPTYPDNGYNAAPAAAPPDNAANYGGVTFDIQPTNAAIYVDGKYIGTVAEFSPQQPPLSLTLGRHHIDLRSQGFQTMSFDLDVVAGQVTPYQGAMTVIR